MYDSHDAHDSNALSCELPRLKRLLESDAELVVRLFRALREESVVADERQGCGRAHRRHAGLHGLVELLQQGIVSEANVVEEPPTHAHGSAVDGRSVRLQPRRCDGDDGVSLLS